MLSCTPIGEFDSVLAMRSWQRENLMLMFRKYSPHFTTQAEISAQRYAEKLAILGMTVGPLLAFPIPQWAAAILAVVLFMLVCVLGAEYRRYEPDFARQFSIWRRLWTLRRAAKFVALMTLAVGVAIGIAQWQGRAEAIHEVFLWCTTNALLF